MAFGNQPGIQNDEENEIKVLTNELANPVR